MNLHIRLISIAIAAAAFPLIAATPRTSAPADLVNPLVGTLSKVSLSTGNTYPAIALPWGMNFWTPQTGKNGDGWAYVYTADKIRGIKQTHQPSPWINDYGQFSLMPTVGAPVFDEEKRASWFSHKAEIAKPYYYSVYLADYDATAEVAPTERAAMFRFSFPPTDSAMVVLDAFDRGSYVRIIPEEQKIVGYSTRNSGGVPDNFRNYFEIVFDHPFTYVAAVDDGDIRADATSAQSAHAGAIVGFDTRDGRPVGARVASSFISPEQASRNMLELDGRDFDAIVADGRNAWNEALGRIEITDPDASDDQLRTFYSCLYRALLFPRSFYEFDADGSPLHYSPYNGEVRPGYMFTDTGFWDTFRALFPLLNLAYPSTNAKMQAGLANAYRESGFLPEWASPGHRSCMVGNNSASVVADGILSGVTPGADVETLWEAVVHGAHAKHPKIKSTGRQGYEYYDSLGYVPYDVGINESAARTLEYAYDDWCIYQLGRALGKPDAELAPFKKNASNYRNLFDADNRLMRGRNADGSFQSPFSPFKWGDAFTEGNSLHYTWSVFHDPRGLINLMGGRDAFNAMLDTVFVLPPIFDDSYYGGVIHEIREMQIMNMGNYAHGNQPIQHMVFLYDYSGEPWKAQYWSREVMDKLYNPRADGYCGDEDNGQTSAWYVFSALGFYPVCPGSGEYALGSPLFRSATIHLENGNVLSIEARNNSQANRYVNSLTFNGKEHPYNFLRRADLLKGGTLRFDMSASPNLSRGTLPEHAPYSFSTHDK